MRSTTRAALFTPLLLLVLAGCSPVVALQPADDAADPACAAVTVRLPSTVAQLPSRQTDAQATGAWGNPSQVILHCGVPSPAPTAQLPCYTIGGVDWLADDRDDPRFVFTTYGRTPAVEVVVATDGDPAVPDDVISPTAVLSDLARAVGSIPAERACIALSDLKQ